VRYAQELRAEGLRTELYPDISRFKKQFGYADKKKIPFVSIIGPSEFADNRVTIKAMTSGEQFTLGRLESIPWLKQQLS
jgi:histidyl-tRNA synthetase